MLFLYYANKFGALLKMADLFVLKYSDPGTPIFPVTI